MSEILQFGTTGAALIALIFAFLAWLLARSTDKSVEKVKSDSYLVRDEISAMKAQVQHVDLEYIKKILVRVSDHETAVKRLSDSIDLTDEKLKSFMNRVNARGQRPKQEPEIPEADTAQGDIVEQLKKSGNAVPLYPHQPQAQTQPKFIRASAAQRRAG
jgi:hypothetical protein